MAHTSNLSRFVLLVLAVLALPLTGCMQTQATMLAREDRPPVPEEQVRVYRTAEAIECTYDEVALIHAQGDPTFTNEHQMIEAAKKRAGKIGANGIVLGPMQEPDALAEVVGSVVGLFSPERRGEMLGVYVYHPCSPRADGAPAAAGRRRTRQVNRTLL